MKRRSENSMAARQIAATDRKLNLDQRALLMKRSLGAAQFECRRLGFGTLERYLRMAAQELDAILDSEPTTYATKPTTSEKNRRITRRPRG